MTNQMRKRGITASEQAVPPEKREKGTRLPVNFTIGCKTGFIMPIEKGIQFKERDVFVNYPFEEVMFRWDHLQQLVFRKFYGKPEDREPVHQENRLFNDALLYGNEMTREQYMNS